MLISIRAFAASVLSLALVSSVCLGADEAKPKKGERVVARPVDALFQLPKELNLTADQQTKLAEIDQKLAAMK